MTAVVVGAVLVVIAVSLLAGGVVALWTDGTRRDTAGYVTTGVHRFSTSGSALATEPVDLGSSGSGWFYGPNVLDKVRIRVTPLTPGASVFVGIGRSADVNRYLAGTSRSVISDFWGNGVRGVAGGTPSSPPANQGFWVTSSAGRGPRTLDWAPTNGSWTVVVMNADARPGIAVATDLGATMPALASIAVALLIAGAIFLVGGGLLIWGAVRRAGRARGPA